jgi:PAS domain S-box-containing protein
MLSLDSSLTMLRERMRSMSRALLALRHPQRSLSGRLMALVLGTTVLALLVAGLALLLTDLRDNRQSWADTLATEAGILALATAPALSFEDRSTAARNLAALQARSSIDAAAVYTSTGELYADYTRSDVQVPARMPQLGAEVHFDGRRAQLLQPIRQSGETLGFIYLEGSYDVSGRIRAYAGILALVMLMSLAVALLASSWLQRAITESMDSMTSVARHVVERRDYSLRATNTTRDEIGLVVAAFNGMLDEVEARTRSLEESNLALKEQATVRLLAEQAARESEKLYRAIGESIEYGVWVCDADGRCLYASDSFLHVIGMTLAQCSEFGWAQALHPEDRTATLAAWADCIRSGENWYCEHRILGTDGHYRDVLAQGVPIRADDGRITRWAGINLDISRLKQTEQALREADRRKDEFLATLAHELRNPLAPIRTAVQLLELQSTDERQRRWGREVIARQVGNMALLLDDLLDVSRITRGRLELKKQFVDLRSIIDAAVETAKPLIETKRHCLSLEIPTQQIIVEADPLRLSQVIGNLLTNAAKYTDPDGRITLAACLSERELMLSVKDSGIGLAAESIPTIFTMFSQVNSALDRAQGGLGIGLSLVKGLVTLHGGTIEARSDGIGRGSEFFVRLPASIVAANRAATHPEQPVGLEHTGKGLGTVIVVDDNREAADTLAMVLRLMGYQAAATYSGSDALRLGAEVRPDAMLLDIGMPGMSGYDTARRIRLEAWGNHILLIALTGWGQEDDKQKAKTMGFDLHLTKPADPKLVERTLADHLQQPGRTTRPLVADARLSRLEPNGAKLTS